MRPIRASNNEAGTAPTSVNRAVSKNTPILRHTLRWIFPTAAGGAGIGRHFGDEINESLSLDCSARLEAETVLTKLYRPLRNSVGIFEYQG